MTVGAARMVCTEEAMLNAANVSVGCPIRANAAWMMEWDTIISSAVKARGKKNRATSLIVSAEPINSAFFFD